MSSDPPQMTDRKNLPLKDYQTVAQLAIKLPANIIACLIFLHEHETKRLHVDKKKKTKKETNQARA